MKSALKITILFFFLFLVISGLSMYWTFYSVVPAMDEITRMPGLKSEVNVRWDAYQVPHIIATDEDDVFMTMGYLHARDRLWQMTTQQYKLQGLHSREIDESLTDTDRFYLTLAFGEKARNAFEQMPLRSRQLLEAYARGVNQYVNANKNHLPLEFSLSDARPLTWEPWHSVGVKLLWAWDHQQAFWSKPAFTPLHFLQDGVVTRALTGMDVPHHILFGTDNPMIDDITFDRLLEDFHSFTDAVSPMITQTTGPGLAIHRQSPEPLSLLFITRESLIKIPDQGYEIAIQSDRGKSAGVTIPGFPAMIYGQSENMAWALQPVAYDDGNFFTGSLFSEPIAEPTDWNADPDIYMYLESDITLERHLLSLKNGGEKLIVTKKAAGRPVVAVSENRNRYLAFEWTGHSEQTDISAYFDLLHVNSPGQLRSIADAITSPAVQVLYTSTSGQAGRLYGGRVLTDRSPLRIRESSANSSVHPASGIFNDQVESDGHPVFLNANTASPREQVGNTRLYSAPFDRSARLQELLDQSPHNRIRNDITSIWHRDTFSHFAARLSPLIVSHLEHHDDDPQIRLILPYLQNWNYNFGQNETAATLFQLFMHHAARNLYLAYLGEREVEMIFRSPQIPNAAVSALIADSARWPANHPYSHRDWIIASMTETVRYLSGIYGSEPHTWQWYRVVDGSFQNVLFEATHRASRSARLAERNLFKPGDALVSGSPHTIQSVHLSYNHGIKVAGATTMKRIMVLQPVNSYHSVLSTGQSGHVFSNHYSDQFNFWNDGVLRPPSFPFSSQTHQSNNIQNFRP